MPWKASSVMEERLRFVARLLEGEPMSELCREFGISRKTGYKVFTRYQEHGCAALTDRSRRPVRYANQLPRQIESLIVTLKRDKPHWGARKIRELLVRRCDGRRCRYRTAPLQLSAWPNGRFGSRAALATRRGRGRSTPESTLPAGGRVIPIRAEADLHCALGSRPTRIIPD